MRSLPVLLLLPLLMGAGAPAWPPAPPLRQRLDRAALRQPLESLAQEKVNIVGNVTGWLLLQLDLPVEEELRRCKDAHADLLGRERTRPAPVVARKILDRLVAGLPAHLDPGAFRWSLTILERKDVEAFTPGGGFLYLSRPLLETLLADRERGEAALAFVLAREIAHVSLRHCGSGWQRITLEEMARKDVNNRLDPSLWRDLLETKLHTASKAVQFLYSRNQEYLADLMALHLCRNTAFPLDAALDGMRLLAGLGHPGALTQDDYRPAPGPKLPVLSYYLSSAADPLVRLRRLLMERDGLVEPTDDFGLFVCDRGTGGLTRCRTNSVTARERPIVFVHGLYGGRESFRPYLDHFREQKELKNRPLLVFRYPGNGSLWRSALLLGNEMKRVVGTPAQAAFVCHSAGGLVFRCYAEKLAGGFDRAVMLGTPHGGSDLTRVKFLVDLVEFAGTLRFGLTEGLAATVAAGRGEIGLDLQPDSLFLRYLGRDAKRAARYHVFYGEVLTPANALAGQIAFTALRRQLEPRLLGVLPEGVLRLQAGRWLGGIHLPTEALRGDWVVSSKSARLPGAARTTKTRLGHLGFTRDSETMRQVLDLVLEK